MAERVAREQARGRKKCSVEEKKRMNERKKEGKGTRVDADKFAAKYQNIGDPLSINVVRIYCHVINAVYVML